MRPKLGRISIRFYNKCWGQAMSLTPYTISQ